MTGVLCTVNFAARVYPDAFVYSLHLRTIYMHLRYCACVGRKRVDKFNVLACVTKVRCFVFRTTYIPPVLMFD